MKGHIIVRRLNKSGIYKSDLDWDNAFRGQGNPKGLFKMVVEPIENSDGEKEIRYMKVEDGYKVSGEAYIVTGQDEGKIDTRIRKRYSEKHSPLVQREVQTKNELW